VVRLVWLYLRATHSEQRGRLSRANFWWGEARRQLLALTPNDPAWEAARVAAGVADKVPAAEFRGHVLRELCLDAHLAFVNSYTGARQAFHWERAAELIRLVPLPDADGADLELQWSARDLSSSAEPSRAAERLEELARRYPSSARVARMKVDLYQKGAEDERNALSVRLDWAARLVRQEPARRWRLLRRRLLRQAVSEDIEGLRWRSALERAEVLAGAEPDARAPESDGTFVLRSVIRRAIAGGEETIAVEAAGRLRELEGDEPGALDRLRSVGWATVRRRCTSSDWAGAATALAHLTPHLGDDWGSVSTLRAALAHRALSRIPAEPTSALTALEDVIGRFEHEPDLHRTAVEKIVALNRRTAEERATRAGGPDSTEGASAMAQVLGQGIDILTRLFRRVPTLAIAGEALAALHFSRAIHLANAARPSDSLLDLEYVAAYDPQCAELDATRAQVEEMLRLLQKRAMELTASLGSRRVGDYTYTSVLNAAGEALVAQARRGFAPRDTFRRSDEPTTIRRRVREARALRFWLRAGLRPVGGWVARAMAFDEATDLLMRKKPNTSAELLVGWMEVLAERPDLLPELDGVGPEHLLAVFAKRSEEEAAPPDPLSLVPQPDLDWLNAPSRFTEPGDEAASATVDEPMADPSAAAAAPTGPAPVLAVPAPDPRDTVTESVPAEFWLFTRRGLKEKAALAFAVVLLLAGAGVVVADARRQKTRDRTFTEVRDAIAAGDEPAARDAIARLAATRPVLSSPGTRAQDQAAAKLTTELDRLDRLRTRNAAVVELGVGLKAYDSNAVKTAAARFRAAAASTDGDPRRVFVEQTVGLADELPALRTRDRAYERLQTAADAGDDPTVVAAGVEFLRARTARLDVRSGRVTSTARSAARRWALTAATPLTPDEERLVAALLEITKDK
jgi:hypothetical protein